MGSQFHIVMIQAEVTGFLPSPPSPDLLWGPSSLLSYGCRRLFLRGKVAWAWSWQLPPSSAPVKIAWSYAITLQIRLHVVMLD